MKKVEMREIEVFAGMNGVKVGSEWGVWTPNKTQK